MCFKGATFGLIIFICLTSFHPSISWGQRSGGVGDGGGSGIACFPSEKIANQAKSFQRMNGFLPDFLKEEIQSISTTDYFESALERRKYLIFPSHLSGFGHEDTTDPKSFLLLLIKNEIELRSPGFAKLLRNTLEMVDYSKWQPDEKLSLISDLGSSQELELELAKAPRCILVQIIHRVFKSTDSSQVEPLIYYDPILYRKLFTHGLARDFNDRFAEPELGVLHQSILLLHEALYVLSAKMNSLTSFQVRRLTMMLLSPLTYIFVETELELMRVLYLSGFDRLDLLYKSNLSGLKGSLKSMAEERFQAYLKLMLRSLNSEIQMAKQLACPHLSQFACDNLEVSQFLLKGIKFSQVEFWKTSLTSSPNEVESFMLMAWGLGELFNPYSLTDSNFSWRLAKLFNPKLRELKFPHIRNLFDPEQEDRDSIVFICKYVQDLIDTDGLRKFPELSEEQVKKSAFGSPEIWKKAAAYCSRTLN